MSLSGLFAPSYYGEFECIKGECRHSCCIGWEIDIDGVTMEKYSSLGGEIGERIRRSISDFCGNVPSKNAPNDDFCTSGGEDFQPHFILVHGDRCPHLDECGLCRIITELGEGYISDICRLHPRFFNETARGAEVGLGMSCEEACRLILSTDGYADIARIGDAECETVDFDITPYRDELYSILSDRSVSYPERLLRIAKRFEISPSAISDGEWRSTLLTLEYLGEGSAERFSHYSSDVVLGEWDVMLERALAYFVYRHASGAKDELEFRTGVGFALFCERLLASVARAEGISSAAEFSDLARLVSVEIEYSSDNTDVIRAEIEFAV